MGKLCTEQTSFPQEDRKTPCPHTSAPGGEGWKVNMESGLGWVKPCGPLQLQHPKMTTTVLRRAPLVAHTPGLGVESSQNGAGSKRTGWHVGGTDRWGHALVDYMLILMTLVTLVLSYNPGRRIGTSQPTRLRRGKPQSPRPLRPWMILKSFRSSSDISSKRGAKVPQITGGQGLWAVAELLDPAKEGYSVED